MIVYIALLTGIAGGVFFGLARPSIAQDSFEQSVLIKLVDGNLYKVTAQSFAEYEYLLREYSSQPEVEYVEPNSPVVMSALPNDPDYFRQWYLPHVDVPEAWDVSTGSHEVVVAVLDTGVDIDHEDLRSNIWVNEDERPYDLIDNDANGLVDDFYGWNFIQDNNDVGPVLNGANTTAANHGTVVAGIIGARGNNNIGVTGINWNVKIMPVKVLDNVGQGDTFAVTRAIQYAIDQGADVINLSFVGAAFSQSLQQVIQRAYDNDVIVVAAAGNEEIHGLNLNTEPAYPVCNDGGDNAVIGVAAVDENNILTSFSNYGSHCIDIAAPGRLFHSTNVYEAGNELFAQKYGSGWSGTSVATPVVSGVAALIKAINPELKAAQIRNIIVNTADYIDAVNESQYRGHIGSGLINAQKAVEAAAATLQGASIQSTDEEFFVFGPGPGGGPHVRILDIAGNVLGQFFAYDESFRGGVQVTSADIDNDGVAEIITAPGAGMSPEIKIFDIAGNLRNTWYAYAPGFTGGVQITTGDVDGDGQPEIITAPLSQGGPHVRVFARQGLLKSQWFAGDQSLRTGLSIAVGDVSGDGLEQLVVGFGAGLSPEVFVFDWLGNTHASVFAYNPVFTGGVNVAIVEQ